MKKYYLVLMCLLSVAVSAQITDLQKLSRGRLMSSDIIKDVNNNIKGYFLLFESDKVAKETYELEYVVLDENLTKVTNGYITEMKFESFLVDANSIDVSVSLYKNMLLLDFADNFNGIQAYRRFRTLDITNNKLSDPFIFNKGEMKLNPVFDRKMKNVSDNQSEYINFYDGVGMIVHSFTTDKKTGMEQYLAHYDENFKEVWRYVYDDLDSKKETYRNVKYLNSDKDVIVMFNHKTKKNGKYLNDYSAIFLDANKGTVIKEFDFPDVDKKAFLVVDSKIKGDKIYLMGNYSKKSDYGFIDDNENTGLFSFVFDKQSGKLLKSEYKTWESLGSALDIKKNGYIKKEGYIFIHNMLLLENDNIIVVAEAFLQSPITTNNMYFMEMTPDLSLKHFYEVTKFRNKFPQTSAHSSDIKAYGLFDFIDYQYLGDDEYLFFLNDNEKKSRNRRKSTLYGITSYSEGKFNRQTLDLKTETSTIHAMNAKKGHLMLVENFDEKNKPTELRLEKINF